MEITYTKIDFPGAKATDVNGVTRRGPLGRTVEIVGSYEDIVGTHGFLYSGGEFAKLDAPGGSGTVANGIASDGKICGWTGDQGFVHDSGTYIGDVDNCPAGGTTSSAYWGLHASGSRVGRFHIETEGEFGFLYHDSACVDFPTPYETEFVLCGINGSGQWVGYSNDAQDQPMHGLFAAYPTASPVHLNAPGSNDTYLRGINDAGIICGYTDSDGFGGFINNHGVYTRVEFPGASRTKAHGISNAAWAPAERISFEVVGTYWLREDPPTVRHGFIATFSEDRVARPSEGFAVGREAPISE